MKPMARSRMVWALGVAAAVGLAALGLAGGAGAHDGGALSVVHACVEKHGQVRILLGATDVCRKHETPIHWGAGRFLDLGKTVFDTKTGLEWEKKTTAAGSGANFADLHDVDNTYPWLTAMGSWITAVNTEKFAGFTDWRVAKQDELTTIRDCSFGSPCIDPIFGPTASALHWSATRENPGPPPSGDAVSVDFAGGPVLVVDTDAPLSVRAVRGGP